jgi:hypothetical protein
MEEQLGIQQYGVVMCSMGAELSNPGFQQATGVRLNKHLPLPVAFDFKRTSGYGTADTIVPYEEPVLNMGNVMSLDGVFTVPVDGIYHFTFATTKDGGDSTDTLMYLRVDGLEVGSMHTHANIGSMVENVILQLRQGQKVDAYFKIGQPISNHSFTDAHFSGHLLFMF